MSLDTLADFVGLSNRIYSYVGDLLYMELWLFGIIGNMQDSFTNSSVQFSRSVMSDSL